MISEVKSLIHSSKKIVYILKDTPKQLYHKAIGKLQYLQYYLKKTKEKFIIFLKDFKNFNYPMSKRVVYENTSKLLNFPTYLARKYLGYQLLKNTQSEITIPTMAREEGFLVWKPENFTPLEEAIEFAREKFRQTNLKTMVETAEGKHKYLLALPIKHELNFDSPFIKLATHPDIVSIATKYLGMLPILSAVNIVYSPNTGIYEHSSQFFHLDPEGIRQVKIFIYVEDVTEDSGPFTLISSSNSAKVYPIYKGGRLTDKAVKEFVSETEFKQMTGSAGTVIFADTSACFHFGSRTGSKDRFALLIQYVSPFSMIYPWFGWVRKARLAHLVNANTPTREKYLLGAK